jgi:hypothetical protein
LRDSPAEQAHLKSKGPCTDQQRSRREATAPPALVPSRDQRASTGSRRTEKRARTSVGTRRKTKGKKGVKKERKREGLQSKKKLKGGKERNEKNEIDEKKARSSSTSLSASGGHKVRLTALLRPAFALFLRRGNPPRGAALLASHAAEKDGRRCRHLRALCEHAWRTGDDGHGRTAARWRWRDPLPLGPRDPR